MNNAGARVSRWQWRRRAVGRWRYLHNPLRLSRSSRPSPRQRGREAQPAIELPIGTETRRMPSAGRDFVIVLLLNGAWPGWLAHPAVRPLRPRIPKSQLFVHRGLLDPRTTSTGSSQ